MAVRKSMAKKATKKTTKKAPAKRAAAKKASPPTRGPKTGMTAVTQNDTIPAPDRLPTPDGATLVVGEGESPWTPEELAEVTAELTEDLERHRRQATAVGEDLDELRKTGEPSGDAADVGTSNFERDQELALAAHAQEAVRQTQLALDRIQAGSWGVCEHCGNPIGKGRLQVYPRATLCMTCKKREERR